MRVAVGVSVGRSAGRMVIARSMPAVSSTQEEGKKGDGAKVGFCAFFEVGICQAGIEYVGDVWVRVLLYGCEDCYGRDAERRAVRAESDSSLHAIRDKVYLVAIALIEDDIDLGMTVPRHTPDSGITAPWTLETTALRSGWTLTVGGWGHGQLIIRSTGPRRTQNLHRSP
jgi:hypothetical protein